MTDLAKLASEITPGTWTKEYGKTLGKIVDVSVWSGDRLIAGWEFATNGHMDANATAFAIVPDLIAEVLRLREENTRQADQIHRFMELTKPGFMRGDTCNRNGCQGKIQTDDTAYCDTCEWDETD